jgi:DNA polymerase I-like protein with 3'-5' exonuclease and polymerase domains
MRTLPYPSLSPFPNLRNVELLDLGSRPSIQSMIRNGSAIDIPYLHELTSQFRSRQQDIAKDIRDIISKEELEEFAGEGGSWDDVEFNPQAPDQVARLLYDALALGKGREIKRTPTGKMSTGKKQLEALRSLHEVIGKILVYREFGKLVNTYTDKLPRMARWHDKGECAVCGRRHHERHPRVHTEFLLTRTETGRISSKSPNLMNIPVRTEWGREVRRAFVAARGTRLVNADYSQEELRLLAHFGNEERMLEVFGRGGDIHTSTAALLFGVEEGEVDPLSQRLPTKNVNFMVCVAGGQHVLTDSGLKPIEEVTVLDKVWDGVEFIVHAGVVSRGTRGVVTHDGLTATPDHRVWTVDGYVMPFGAALRNRRTLLPTAVGEVGTPYHGRARVCGYPKLISTIINENGLPRCEVYDILNCGPRHRFTCEGKLVGNCYQASPKGVQAQLALSGLYWTVKECEDFISLYFSRYSGVKRYLEEQEYLAYRYGMVWDGFGRVLAVPEVRSSLPYIQEQGVRRAGNHRIQGTAAGVMRLALREVEEVPAAPTLTVHDELTLEAEEEEAEDVKEMLEVAMLEAWERGGFRCGMKVEGKVMERWEKG